MKRTRKLIKIDEQLCNGCGECIPACKEGALKIVNGKARFISEKYCDLLGLFSAQIHAFLSHYGKYFRINRSRIKSSAFYLIVFFRKSKIN